MSQHFLSEKVISKTARLIHEQLSKSWNSNHEGSGDWRNLDSDSINWIKNLVMKNSDKIDMSQLDQCITEGKNLLINIAGLEQKLLPPNFARENKKIASDALNLINDYPKENSETLSALHYQQFIKDQDTETSKNYFQLSDSQKERDRIVSGVSKIVYTQSVLDQYGYKLKDIPVELISAEVALIAFKVKDFYADGNSIKFVPDDILLPQASSKLLGSEHFEKTNAWNISPDVICQAAVEANAWDVLNIPRNLLSSQMLFIAVSKEPEIIKNLIDPKNKIPQHFLTSNLFREAVRRDGSLLPFVPERALTQEICDDAMRQNPELRIHVPTYFEGSIASAVPVKLSCDSSLQKNAKYKLAFEGSVIHNGIKLFPVIALMEIPEYGVNVGDLGGFIQSTDNFKQKGGAWIGQGSRVMGKSVVSGDCLVTGMVVLMDSKISDNALVTGLDDTNFDDAKATKLIRTIVSDDAQVIGAKSLQDSSIKGFAKVGEDVSLNRCRINDHVTINSNGQTFVLDDKTLKGDENVVPFLPRNKTPRPSPSVLCFMKKSYSLQLLT